MPPYRCGGGDDPIAPSTWMVGRDDLIAPSCDPIAPNDANRSAICVQLVAHAILDVVVDDEVQLLLRSFSFLIVAIAVFALFKSNGHLGNECEKLLLNFHWVLADILQENHIALVRNVPKIFDMLLFLYFFLPRLGWTRRSRGKKKRGVSSSPPSAKI